MMPRSSASDDAREDLGGVRCLVLGGGGFLGINLCNALVACGATVHAFGRTLAWPGALEPRVTWTSAFFADAAALDRAVQGQHVVFHLISSSVPGTSNRNPAADLEANVLATVRLLEMCRIHRIRQVIFPSSGGTVYGLPKTLPIPETAPTEPISAYGVGKLAIEKYLALYHHLHGLDYRILRIANAYGPYQTAHKGQGVVAAMIRHALSGSPMEVWGTGEVVRDFIHVDDVVSAMIHAHLYVGPEKIMNVGSGNGLSINQVGCDIETVLGRGRLRRAYRPAQGADVPANVLDISLVSRETGWHPRVPWLEGLRRTVRWMSKHDVPASRPPITSQS